MSKLGQRIVLAAKKITYARRGEPYRIGPKTLRFVPGTRPVRLHYQTAENTINRYDAIQLALILDNLSEGDLAIDVGANCGQCTIVMAELCGASGDVIAFEPNPNARSVLSRNFDLNPHIKRATIEPAACSDIIGSEIELYQNGNTANSALVSFVSQTKTRDEDARFRVPMTTLDLYIAERRLKEPRCVKIDTEGAEIRILRGAQGVLAGPATILCELHPYAWPQFGNSLGELKALVAEYGRRMRYLDQDSDIGDEARYGIVTLQRIH